MGHVGQEAWEARPNRHEWEAPSDQMRKERIRARIIMEELANRHHKVDR